MNIRSKQSLVAVALIPVLGVLMAVPRPAPQQMQPDLATGSGFSAPSFCPNKIKFEPVVIYDVSGSTFAGPFHQHLTVYSSGTASLSRNSSFGGSSVESVQVSSADLLQLQMDLDAIGARTLCDIPTVIADVPLTTITVFSGRTDARAHTFSFFLSIKGQGAAKQVLESFITTHFSLS